MKKLILMSGILLISTFLFAADGDIPQVEVKPDVTVWELDTVKFLVKSKTCIVTYRKVDAGGNIAGKEFDVIFTNIPDDLETPQDETDNQFSQLITAINSGSNIKTTVTNAVKIKLGI